MDWNDRDDTFDSQKPDTWDDTSFAGQERDLADLLDDSALDALGEIYEGSITDFSDHSFAFYTLLMMHDEAFLALTGASDTGPMDERRVTRMALRSTLQNDANENSGDYFEIRLRQRLQEGG